MVLEVATLDVTPGKENAFEEAFATALPRISSIKGFIPSIWKGASSVPPGMCCW